MSLASTIVSGPISDITASKALSLIGGLICNSPTFEGKVADPVFLENKTGWMWQVGPNQPIVVRFERPLDKIMFERNNKNDIRTLLHC